MSPMLFWFGYLLGLGLGFWGGWIFGHPKGYTRGCRDERARWLPIIPHGFAAGRVITDEEIESAYEAEAKKLGYK